MSIRLLHHLLLPVRDLDRATDFYSRLGMEPIPSLDPNLCCLYFGSSELHLRALEAVENSDAVDDVGQEEQTLSGSSRIDDSLCRFALEVEDLQAVAQLIPEIGGQLLDEIRQRDSDNSRYLLARDPDGHTFELTQHSEEWLLRLTLVELLKQKGVLQEPRVEAALRLVPRHLFLPGKPLAQVYANEPVLTKDEGEARSSSSQPEVVASMLQSLQLQPGQNVLEIGAGTGWNAALMGALVGAQGRITTLDIDADTCEFARTNLAGAGVLNVQVVHCDGGFGWEQKAPFDAVIATVGISDMAPAWIEQLKIGGRLVAPLWFNTTQFCATFEKRGEGLQSLGTSWMGFMPLRGHFATAPMREEGGKRFHCDEMHGFDIAALGALLDSPPLPVEAPEALKQQLLHPYDGHFLPYLALRGEPLLMVTPPAGPHLAFALSVSSASLLLLDGSLRCFGSAASLERLLAIQSEWEACGEPGLAQSHITVAPPGTLEAIENRFLVRKTWADYQVWFESKT